MLHQTVLFITSRHGQHRKHRSSIVALVSVAAETYLTNFCLETGCKTPLFYCCWRYLAMAPVFKVTAYQHIYTPQYVKAGGAYSNHWDLRV
jgi:hypothetical protein